LAGHKVRIILNWHDSRTGTSSSLCQMSSHGWDHMTRLWATPPGNHRACFFGKRM